MEQPLYTLIPALLFLAISTVLLLNRLRVGVLFTGLAFVMVSLYLVVVYNEIGLNFIVTDRGKLIYAAWIMLLSIVLRMAIRRHDKGIEYFSVVIIVFLLFKALLTPISPPENNIVYERIDAMLFFLFRSGSMGMFMLAVSFFASVLFIVKKEEQQRAFLHYARNYTLWGAAAFLAGEVVGSYWAFEGWGDPWRWSKNFMLAGGMFLLSMLPAHLPPRFGNTGKNIAWQSALPLLVILFLYFY